MADPAQADPAVDLATLRARMQSATGREYWRSLEALAGDPAFDDLLLGEFPRQAAPLTTGLERRQFLKLMSASLALGGLGACTRQPEEKIVPYVKQPEEIVPGVPLYFATAMEIGGVAVGLLAESHMGRPTKLEGNPEHPGSLGATDATIQAAVLGLYDPDRSQVVTNAGEIRSWSAMLASVRAALEGQKAAQGAGLRILTGSVASPTLTSQVRDFLSHYPQARWHHWEPVGEDGIRDGSQMAFGEQVDTTYRLAQARVILSLDADFLGQGQNRIRYAKDFAASRRLGDAAAAHAAQISRLYVAESTPSITGAKADVRIPIRSSDIEDLTRLIAIELGLGVRKPANPDHLAPLAKRAHEIAEDLRQAGADAVVIPGTEQPGVVHALAHLINHRLGNVGRTVVHTDPISATAESPTASLRLLVEEMRAGQVSILFVLGTNPVQTAPADLAFADALQTVPLRVHLGPYADETALLCQWHVPEAHFLESWSDTRALDGTTSIVQPLIAPLYQGKTTHELFLALSDTPDRSSYETIRDYWKTMPQVTNLAGFESFWRKVVHDGVIPGTAAAPRGVTLRTGWDSAPAKNSPSDDLEIVFRPDFAIYDGRFANNGWLLELPRPITKLTWDNAALVSPATAARLDVRSGDLVELRRGERTLRTAIWIAPGHADGSITLDLGFGRAAAGRVAKGAGFDAYHLRTSDAMGFGGGLQVRKLGETYKLVSTQDHGTMAGRALVRRADIGEYREHPDFAQHAEHVPPRDLTMYPEWKHEGYAWGMAIDLNACTGCSACVTACQAENNIAVVGKDQVSRGREMQWIRIDRYYQGDPQSPEILHQPVTCMQCENAPCEVVCPVQATVHSPEGLNDMVYNRCIGTRYCSNNCPYKVRRFNFLLYSNWTIESLKMVNNPDVTVRSRGVMEKCTYCVQRINFARIQAEREGRRIRDGEIVTACQQTCPADAITFGDLSDPESRISRAKREPRNYALLGDLNTRPRTTYLAAVRNPNETSSRDHNS